MQKIKSPIKPERKKGTETHPSPSTAGGTSYLLLFFKQVVVAVATLALVYLAYESSATYRWVYSGLLKGNYEVTRQYPNATFLQKSEMKLGAMVPYLNFIKENTPDSAVILFPRSPDECYNKTKNDFDLKQLENNTLVSYGYTRFLWPRRWVTENRKGETPLFDRATHVAIVNGWGYQYLNYLVEKPSYLGVYPLTR